MDNHSRRSWRRQLRAVASMLVMILIVAACSSSDDDPAAALSSDDDPAAVLAAYQDTRNSGDVDAVIAFYAEDAVVMDHPRDADGIANGIDEIRSLEASVPRIQGSTGGIEFIDIEVSGSTVTFNHKFHNARGDCFGGVGGQVTVAGGMITLYDWGPEDPSQCG